MERKGTEKPAPERPAQSGRKDVKLRLADLWQEAGEGPWGVLGLVVAAALGLPLVVALGKIVMGVLGAH